MKLIEQGGLDVEEEDGKHQSPLRLAASLGHVDVVKYLISKNAVVDKANEAGETALFVASSKGFPLVVELLAQHGASLEVKDKTGTTPILVSCDAGYPLVTRFLLSKGCDVNSKSGTGRSCLIRAAQYGHLGVVEVLLDHNALVDVRDNEGRSALLYAASRNYIEGSHRPYQSSKCKIELMNPPSTLFTQFMNTLVQYSFSILPFNTLLHCFHLPIPPPTPFTHPTSVGDVGGSRC